MKNFLHHVRPEGYLNLVAISPDGNHCSGRTFEMPSEVDDAVAWAMDQNMARRQNVYWAVNPLRQRVDNKSAKEDILHVEWGHVDIDPDPLKYLPYDSKRWETETRDVKEFYYQCARGDVLAKVTELEAQGAMVVDTGNGIAAYWRLKQPVSIEEGEAINKQLVAQWGGDRAAINADRVMRLPYTRNYPTRSKIDKGYPELPREATVLVPWHGQVHDAATFAATLPPLPVAPNKAAPVDTCESSEEVREILDTLNPDMGYQDWIKVGMGIHAAFDGSEYGFVLWRDWSAKSAKYPGENQLRYKYQRFKANKGITFASVCHLASKAGADLGAIARKWRGPDASVVFGGGISEDATRLAQEISKSVGGVAIDVDAVNRTLNGTFWSGQKCKLYIMTERGDLNQFTSGEAINHLTEEFGPLCDRDLLEAAAEAEAGQQRFTKTETKELIRERLALPGKLLLKHLRHYHQRDHLEMRVDMFAEHGRMELKDERVRIVCTHKRFKPTLKTYDPRVIDDFVDHFPIFDDFLNFLVASRFARDRKLSYMWFKCESDWGKGFLLSILGSLGLTVEISGKEIEAIFEGKPVGRSMTDFKRQFALVVDEFKAVNSEMKQLQNEMGVAAKHQLTVSVELFAKLFFSAESVESLAGDHGVEDQFANRFSYYEGRGRINARPLFQEIGEAAYADNLQSYVAHQLNNKIDWYIQQGRAAAEVTAGQYLRNFHSTYSIERIHSRFSDTLGDVAQDIIRWLHEKYRRLNTMIAPDPKLAALISENMICYDDNWYLKSPAKMISIWSEAHLDEPERVSIKRKKAELRQLMSGDGNGYFSHRHGDQVVKCILLKKLPSVTMASGNTGYSGYAGAARLPAGL